MARRAAFPNPAQLSLFDAPAPTALIPAPRVPEIPFESAPEPKLEPGSKPEASTGCD